MLEKHNNLENILTLKEVTIRRESNPKPVIENLTLAVQRGSWITICGQNGAGKTTLARALMGLVPLAGGHIHMLGGRRLENGLRAVQMVFQPPSAQIIGDTVFEELAMTLHQHHATRTLNDAQDAIVSICDRVGLNVDVHTSVRQLSGGQLQRLCIAQALLSGADIIIFDEALSALTPNAQSALRQMLRQLVSDEQKTIIMITHDMEDVLASDRVLVIDNGQLVADLTPEAFFYAPIDTPSARHADNSVAPTACANLGFISPYLVQVAQAYNQATGQGIQPRSENQLLEAISHGATIE